MLNELFVIFGKGGAQNPRQFAVLFISPFIVCLPYTQVHRLFRNNKVYSSWWKQLM